MEFPHWVQVTDRGFELPVAIFDMDGVLSDATHRQEFLRASPPDWISFGDLAHLDEPVAFGQREVERYRQDHCVVLVTARPIERREGSLEWLARYGFSIDLAIFRPSGDERPSHELKGEELERIRTLGGDVKVAHEDELQNLVMYGRAGIPAVYVHSGYYDEGTVTYN
ncbi:MAG: hypothetical protein ACI9MX_000025 [Candidatus Aldehydirespiratoraceae bacterium]